MLVAELGVNCRKWAGGGLVGGRGHVGCGKGAGEGLAWDPGVVQMRRAVP